ncbi:predicted protein [Uncinocarpus reesii 1704]|uniref:Uncharacterized protein n=1 Tax=Uncinocarpus reesii (strain UAMH 1704) TaxID=336963 RepID=C4JZ43_UNCRE|nr:uncharacterized protein UREG_07444 [Uncinocarpus reesii 1704]EEP82579.1 predicted protein [Uncinocarpus reesii 1704]
MPTTRSKSKAADPEIMTDSGSEWGQRQTIYFRVNGIGSKARVPPMLAPFVGKAVLDSEVRRQLQNFRNHELGRMDLHRIVSTVAGTSAQAPAGTLLGLFLMHLAMVKEAPFNPDDQLPPRRYLRTNRAQVQRPGFVSSEVIDDDGSETSLEETTYPNKRLCIQSWEETSIDTDKSTHMLRVKSETQTQLMISLFLTSIFECSNLSGRGTSLSVAKYRRWEWHAEGKELRILSPRVNCVSINDGSLRRKGIGQSQFWGFMDDMIYCSVETKSRLGQWDEDELMGIPNTRVDAQEASQLIGMMCERLREKSKTGRVDPFKLREYDRTSTPVAQLDDLDMKVTNDPPPTLNIFRTPRFDLSRSKGSLAAARLVLALGSYIDHHGPLCV